MMKTDLGKVHDELLHEIFGKIEGDIDVSTVCVRRGVYTKAMKKVQDKYGLRQGHPDFLEWVFTCVGRSPIIIEDKEGAEDNGTEST